MAVAVCEVVMRRSYLDFGIRDKQMANMKSKYLLTLGAYNRWVVL